jgi:hypothetical protein
MGIRRAFASMVLAVIIIGGPLTYVPRVADSFMRLVSHVESTPAMRSETTRTIRTGVDRKIIIEAEKARAQIQQEQKQISSEVAGSVCTDPKQLCIARDIE